MVISILKLLLRAAVWFFFVSLPIASAAAASFPACECPDVQCAKGCEEQTDLKFYTEKCGPGGMKVRSCAKPTCVNLDPFPATCAVSKKDTAQRAVASVKSNKPVAKEQERSMAGTIEILEGKAWIKEPNGRPAPAKVGSEVYELDTIITAKKSRLQMKFTDGNLLSLTPGSELLINTMKDEPEKNNKSTVLKLLKGKVRSKVKKKYKGSIGSSYYKVKTSSAVAGVRGTDFVVSFDVNHKEVTRVETLSGEVRLGSPGQEQKIDIGKGEYASFVAEPSHSDVFKGKDIEEFVSRGYLTPVYKLSKAEIDKIAFETEFKRFAKRQKMAKKKRNNLCRQPAAELNQCSWTCENNPKSATRCRTDLPQVKCVRRRCNANGDWKGETRLPASFYDMCLPNKIRVDNCDY